MKTKVSRLKTDISLLKNKLQKFRSIVQQLEQKQAEKIPFATKAALSLNSPNLDLQD